jgi:hypothetical protein
MHDALRKPEAGAAAANVPRLALSADEMATSISVCSKTLWDWTRRFGIPFLKLANGKVLYPVKDVEAWLSENATRLSQETAD